MSTPSISHTRVRELTTIALIAVMVLIAKTVLRMPIKLPGHSGVLWIALLLIGRFIVRRPGAATAMGLIGGTLIALFQPSDAGLLFSVAKYVLPGLVLDVLAPLFGARFDLFMPAIVSGATAHASKVAVDLVQGCVAGLRGAFLLAGTTAALVFHIAFGALGGLVAVLVLRMLIRARVPQVVRVAGNGDST